MTKQRLTIVKIGGKIIDDPLRLDVFLESFSTLSGPRILIHGGGKVASDLAAKLGVDQRMYNGRRITDIESLKIVTMVYAGLINKQIVAKLQVLGQNAIGLSGADFNLLTAIKRSPGVVDYGYVGDFHKGSAHTENLAYLLKKGIPVFCSIVHDGKGHLLNVNADTLAAELAASLSGLFETHLYYCFEKKGVLMQYDDDDSVISQLNQQRYNELKIYNTVKHGMIPKLENAFAALNGGATSVCIIQDNALIQSVKDPKNHGTTISLY
ncbi:MAG: acetylglutamate kinase [Bacteroidales bacterium]|nr:acetylglutamate kinase [Bacteroidales bacterium]